MVSTAAILISSRSRTTTTNGAGRRVVQARPHRAFRNSERLGDLGVREAFDREQRQHEAMLERQRAERASHRIGFGMVGDRIRGATGACCWSNAI